VTFYFKGVIFLSKLVPRKTVVVKTLQQLRTLAYKMSKLEEFAFDTETNSLRALGPNKKFKCVDISISWGLYDNYLIPMGHIFDYDQLSQDLVVKYLKPVFEREDVVIIGHNIKFDMHVIARIGINVRTKLIFDTMIASWLCDENTPNGLKENVLQHFGVVQTPFKETVSTVTKEQKIFMGMKPANTATFDMVSIEVATPYAIDDAFYTFQLYQIFLDRLIEEEMDKIYFKTYPPFIYSLYHMEEQGITVDKAKMEKIHTDILADLEILDYELIELAGAHVELGSTQQLAQLLFGFTDFKTVIKDIIDVNFGFPIESKTPKGLPQVSGAVLEKISEKQFKSKRKMEGVQFCKLMCGRKKLATLDSMFAGGLVDKMYDDGKIHASANPIGTDSGRTSMSDPNLQQLPKSLEDDESGLYELVKKYQIRDCFIGNYNEVTKKRDDIISIDYSNLEVRIMAHFSKDPALLNAFAQGKDLHGNTAKMMFRLECDANEVKKLHPNYRQLGKVIAFLLQYGGSAYGLYCSDLNKHGELDDISRNEKDDKKSDFYGCKDGKAVAQRLIDLYFTGFKGIADFMKSQKKFAHKNLYVYSLVGRKRRLPEINSGDFKVLSYNERLSINACIQGSGADIMINAQNKIDGHYEQAPMSQAYYKDLAEAKKAMKVQTKTKEFIGSARLKELQCIMLVQIHDELLFSCPKENCEEAMLIIRDYMINPFGEKVKLNLPLEVGMGHSKSYAGGHE
jgi:DNA polymerase-1